MTQEKKETANEYRLLDYVDTATLKKILEAFTTTTNLKANIVDQRGKSIFSRSDVSECCKFCRIIFSLPNGLKRCQQAYERAGKQAALFKEPYIFRCPAGLMEFAAPIIVNKEHIGTIICGQVLMWKPEDFFWIELREMNKDLNVDFRELFASVEELPILSGPQVQAASYLLYVVANYIMNAGWKSYQQSKQVELSYSLLHDEISNRKSLERKLTGENSVLVKESEITGVLLGDEKDKNTYFSRLTAAVRVEASGNISVLRSRVAELMAMIMRSTQKMGIDPTNYAFFADRSFLALYSSENENDVVIMINAFADYFFNMVKKERELPANISVREMMNYISENYSHDLSLVEIASSASLSPSYASRLFKKVTGVAINSYIVETRMENAKKFLVNPHYQIEQIASNVGYTDSSYFTKAFKKYEGVTPSSYRKHFQ